MAHARTPVQQPRQTARARLYARVSSKDQEKEGFSIPAQLKLLREYAAAQGLAVAEEYVDIETAKRTGRGRFGQMVDDLRARPDTRIVLVEKTDRLYRNLKDWVTLDELDVEVHLVKEGVVLSRESRSSEKFMHGIKVLMAKNYIDNLSEETRKGMTEKAQQGLWPSYAPIGYRNVVGANGRKMIEPDPAMAPVIVRLFEWYATGTMSLTELMRKARGDGFSFRKSGDPVPRSTIHAILRKRLYMGEVDWDGHIYPGVHEPLVSRDLWERVQTVLDGRHATRHRRVKRDFAFSRLITCGHCGCAVVGEIQETPVRLLPLHRLQGEMPRALRARRGARAAVQCAAGPLTFRCGGARLGAGGPDSEPRERTARPRRSHRAPPGRVCPTAEPPGRDVCR